jgi:hypothetical protein
MRTSIAFAAAAALACLGAAPAFAGDVSFVSVTGDDTRNCAAPATACRTFQRAHDATSPHGEIIALTPGDYRPVTIFKSISITGVEGAGIFGGADNQITVSALDSDVVHLTGLTLEGAASAARGVRVDGGYVTIRKCAIRNMAISALYYNFASGLIEDSSISNGNANINVRRGSALVHRVVSRAARAHAITLDGGGATISETVAADSPSGIFQGGALFMTRSTVTGNVQHGMDGGFTSAGDNFIRGNGTNVSGTIANIGRQ